MPEINNLLNNFSEEIIQRTFNGLIINGVVNWENKPILIELLKIESEHILFDLDNSPLRVSILKNEFNIDENYRNKLAESFIWITNFKENIIECKYLPCGKIHYFTESLEIGFGDEIIMGYKDLKIEELSKKLEDEFVFKSNNSFYIFIETHLANVEKSFTLYGFRKRANIIVENNKWIIKKIKNKPFTTKYDDFLLLKVAKYPNVKFVEASKAKEAYESIKSEEVKGNTLLSLWDSYSKIEYKRAEDLKNKIGRLSFKRLRFLPQGITKVQITNLNEELKILIKENIDDLVNISLELITKENLGSDTNENFRNSNNEYDSYDLHLGESNKTKAKRFTIKSINNDYTLELYDELNLIPEKGNFIISIFGDEVIKKRRERALKILLDDNRFITRNLLLAIENQTNAMQYKSRNEKAITERTKKFLKEKLGINNLTPNQIEAVHIAINTPDLAIIQGPPGTGKTTVVAAICERLLEIAEKSNNKDNSKLILLSAFQNDTVEHIASKIFTRGLPTIKVGKETQSNIKPEDKFIENIKLHIENALQQFSARINPRRLSRKFLDIKNIYLKEKDENKLIQDIEASLDYLDDDELWNEWKEISEHRKLNEKETQKRIQLLKDMRTEKELYNIDGYEKIIRILKSKIPFTEEEKSFLESCPIDNPDELILKRLEAIKETYLERFNNYISTISSKHNLSVLEWIDKVILYFQQKEEVSYMDEEMFLVATLETIKEDLDGNVEYIRKSIKEYTESLAATNQVTGGKEISSFSFENVILEEAARSNPLELIIPMTRATERIILVGDQNQLPHILEDDIVEETAKNLSDKFTTAEVRKKLAESLFGLLFKNLQQTIPRRTITLTEQFRMHPFIGDFISRVYYNNTLKSGLANQGELKKHNLKLDWAKDKVAIFFNVDKTAGLESSGKSKSRNAESKKVVEILDQLKTDPSFDKLNVGIITFYAKQVEDIFQEASKRGYTILNTDGNYEIATQFRVMQDGREKLRIGTVDSFQGKEFDIVILSTVRSNLIERTHENYKKVFGFLTLENRLNVAFSRAIKLLIVVGDGEMFADEYAKIYVEGLYEFYNHISLDPNYGNRL
ncbi:MAG: AAA domain-containing protein [Ignavibacteria bacterium]|jgi:adenylate kinase family enzyme|nr:AAA domain-containing protein [Ignavibacteria bacterium]MDH7528975.1 AAA domain-containing protein [Ignavibacteria bacterium]